MDVSELLGWTFAAVVLAIIVFSIPVSMAVKEERRYQREVRRRLAGVQRIHEWRERTVKQDHE